VSYRDRLRELVYVSPKGNEFRPLWNDLVRSNEKKAAVHEIVGSDEASVQDLGNGNLDYPHTLYFFGPDYDKTADAFFEALREKGPATLKHPRWGDLRVLPVKSVQKENLVDASRCAVFEIDFIAAPDRTIKTSSNTAAAIQSSAENAAVTVASGKDMVANTAAKLAQIKNAVKKIVKQYRAVFETITDAVESVRLALETAARDIENGIDALLEDPALLAQSLVGLSRTPARLDASIKAKVDGYKTLIGSSVDSLAGLDTPAKVTLITNLAGLAVSACESVTAGTLTSRADAMAVRTALDDSFTAIFSAFDTYYTPDPDTLNALSTIRAQVSDYLLDAAYSLPSDRTITTDREYFALDLAYELTGDADKAPELATLNEWGGDMLIVIPKGTVVHFYA